MILAYLSAAPSTSFPAPALSRTPGPQPRRVGLELESTASHRAGALLALSRGLLPSLPWAGDSPLCLSFLICTMGQWERLPHKALETVQGKS